MNSSALFPTKTFAVFYPILSSVLIISAMTSGVDLYKAWCLLYAKWIRTHANNDASYDFPIRWKSSLKKKKKFCPCRLINWTSFYFSNVIKMILALNFLWIFAGLLWKMKYNIEIRLYLWLRRSKLYHVINFIDNNGLALASFVQRPLPRCIRC